MPKPSRIAVVLSAGGLRGAAHLGVLRRLVQIGLPIDVMVGVSAGAIIAGFYARRTFQVGETMTVGGEQGTLTAITPTQTLLRQGDQIVAVPNSAYLDGIVRQ